MKLIDRHILTITVALIHAATATVFAETNTFETRAIWATPGSFATKAAADQMLARCQQAGLNLILADVMCYQSVYFKSSHFQGRVRANDRFDALANLIGSAHARGIKVQPWCCVYYEGARNASNESSNPSWLNRSIDGEPFEQNFFSASNPEVNPYLLSVIKDLLAYDIDGIHLDYIRYPGAAFDYSAAGIKAFQREGGFDPQDFLGHAERIVPPDQEKFPIRVLHPNTFTNKVWEVTGLERTLDQTGIGFAYIPESPEAVASLRAPGLLMVSSYYEVPEAMVDAMSAYVERGGNILWTDIPSRSIGKASALQKLTGLSSGHWIGQKRIALRPIPGQPLAATLPTNHFSSDSVVVAKLAGAHAIANYEDGTPAITLNAVGKGHVMVTSFHLMKSTSPTVAAVARQAVEWFKAEAGATGPEPLAAKRAEWIKWRGDRVTQLVRDISIAAKKAKPEILISSSGGPSDYEFYSCYRDAGRWLAEGINDEVFPMNYTPDPAVLTDILEWQNEAAPAGKRHDIYPGLQIYTNRMVDGKKTSDTLAAEVVDQQLQVVQKLGYHGFCLFAYDYLNDDLIEAVRKYSRQK